MDIKKGKNKRFVAIFKDGDKIEFGAKNPKLGTFIDGRNKEARENYLKRHTENPKEKKFLKNKDKYFKSPSVLSADILWGKSQDINKNLH